VGTVGKLPLGILWGPLYTPAPPLEAHTMPRFRHQTQQLRPHRLPAWLLPFLLAASAVSGCSTLGRPEWLQPGPEANQRRRAVRFDPYLQNDIGPYQFRLPLMDGTRPRDYAEPITEVKRSRWWSGGR
jgi:hypothetical protein